jgi:antitoxin MazE
MKPPLPVIPAKAGIPLSLGFASRAASDRLAAALVRGPLRSRWADAAKALAEAGDDAPVWPDFANDDDDKLTW